MFTIVVFPQGMIIVFTVRSQCGAMTAGVLVNSVKIGRSV